MPEYPEASYSINDEVIDIVSTKGKLGGAPRIDGHRIAVYHILGHYRTGSSVEEITGNEIYPHLSEAQVKGALHYAIDYPEAVELASKPRDTPLKLAVSYNTQRGGPTLSVFDLAEDEPGAIATKTISIDDLPDGYSEQELHAAWAWMFESGDRPDFDGSDGIETASSGRDDWGGTTPADAGESLFGEDGTPHETQESDDL